VFIERLLQGFFERLLLREDVLEGLRADATLSEPLRAQALVAAERYPEDAGRLNEESWNVVRPPGGERAAYLRALRLAQAACRIAPQNGTYLNTLGVAQYRAGQYRAALVTLTRSDQLNSQTLGSSIPEDLAFLAMTHFRLGDIEKADAAFVRLREAIDLMHRVKKPGWVVSAAYAQGFLGEAESLIPNSPELPQDVFAP
jgi:tetratricopeptide (TPR) repeat protein